MNADAQKRMQRLQRVQRLLGRCAQLGAGSIVKHVLVRSRLWAGGRTGGLVIDVVVDVVAILPAVINGDRDTRAIRRRVGISLASTFAAAGTTLAIGAAVVSAPALVQMAIVGATSAGVGYAVDRLLTARSARKPGASPRDAAAPGGRRWVDS